MTVCILARGAKSPTEDVWRVQVFCGDELQRQRADRPCAGTLVLTTDEWRALVAQFTLSATSSPAMFETEEVQP